jgi:site-specific DNA-methyltransferase (adenine-specific)
MQMMPTFSRWEYGWTSFDKPAKTFEYRSQTTEEVRFHPTQKPVALYEWLLTRYAKQGDKYLTRI